MLIANSTSPCWRGEHRPVPAGCYEVPAVDAMRREARRAVLDVLIAMLWIDGRAAEGELVAARGAATALGLMGIDDVVAMGAPALQDLPLESLDGSERHLAYVAAAWMSLADGVVVPSESTLLESLRQRLELGLDQAAGLRCQARELRSAFWGEPPTWREFDRLVVDVARSSLLA